MLYYSESLNTLQKNMFNGAVSFVQDLNTWYPSVYSVSADSNLWCSNGAVCNASKPSRRPTLTPSVMPSDSSKCDGLEQKKCKKNKQECKFNSKKKINGNCKAKNNVYEHDCDKYISNELCGYGDNAGLCMWKEGVCSHMCDNLTKKRCKKKLFKPTNKKMCTTIRVQNPCYGCHLKTEC